MSIKSKTRFVSDVKVSDRDIQARRPFRVEQDEQRRFIRLEFAAPIWLKDVRDENGRLVPIDREYTYEGLILNVSAGGVLIDTNHPFESDQLVLMRFTLQETEILDNILGLVKRVERDDEGCLVGIEFTDLPRLKDRFSHGELELLAEFVGDFEHRVRSTLEKYLYKG